MSANVQVTERSSGARAGAQVRSADTRDRIIDATERLCGERGLEAVSVRDIAEAAAVNLSAINYHFGSRVKLLLAVLQSRTAELDEERRALLDQAGASDPPDLRAVLRALLMPLARWRTPDRGRKSALQFLCRALTTAEPELKKQIDGGVAGFRRVVQLLQRCVPQLDFEEVCWRLHFTMSIAHMNYWDVERLKILSDGRCHPEDLDESLERAVDFAVAGFLAPVRRFPTQAGGTTRKARPAAPRPARARR